VTGTGMSRLHLLWNSSVGKKVVMAATGIIWVAYLVTHVLANLLVFQGPGKINAYSAFLHGTGGALWGARLVLIGALVLHVIAAAQLADRWQDARPVAYAAGRKPHTSSFAARTIRWGGALILLFLVYHILHFTVGTAHPSFVEGNPYHNVATGFRHPAIVALYLVAMAAVGLHLYHGVWSSGRSLGMSPPSPRPLRRSLALVLALLIWLGFSIIPVAVYAGVVR
jgi:succinate dehydrogenase / fumarate reductase cytochrome b subunit